MATLNPPGSSVKVEVPEASVDRYLSQGWRKAGASAPQADDSSTCPECGFVAKSEAGLAVHRRRHEEG